MAKRNLTPADLDAAARLRRIWNQKKYELNLTQEEVAHQCGWGTQGTFSHYLQGRLALNTDTVLKLAKLFQVSPGDIMPEVAERLAPFVPTVSESALRLIQEIETLPEPAQNALRALVSAVAQARAPAAPPISEEALRVAQAIEALPSNKRAAIQVLIDSYQTEEA